MADTKISALASASALAGTEVLAIVQTTTKKIAAATLVADCIVGVAAKASLADADSFGVVDSAASNVLKEHTWAQMKAAMTHPVYIHCRVSATYTTALAATANQFRYYTDHAFTLTKVVARLVTAQATDGAGGIITIDVHDDGTTVFSTKVTIDNTELTSATAATPAVISAGTIGAGSVLTIDVDQIGDGTAQGLDVYLIGTRVA